MENLTGKPPRGIRRTGMHTLFYYDIDPSQLASAPKGAEFTVVYSPLGRWTWRAIRFRIIGSNKGNFDALETRLINPDEIAYFERLLKNIKSE